MASVQLVIFHSEDVDVVHKHYCSPTSPRPSGRLRWVHSAFLSQKSECLLYSGLPREAHCVSRERSVDLRRIELLYPGCKPGALPLSYRPRIYHLLIILAKPRTNYKIRNPISNYPTLLCQTVRISSSELTRWYQ